MSKFIICDSIRQLQEARPFKSVSAIQSSLKFQGQCPEVRALQTHWCATYQLKLVRQWQISPDPKTMIKEHISSKRKRFQLSFCPFSSPLLSLLLFSHPPPTCLPFPHSPSLPLLFLSFLCFPFLLMFPLFSLSQFPQSTTSSNPSVSQLLLILQLQKCHITSLSTAGSFPFHCHTLRTVQSLLSWPTLCGSLQAPWQYSLLLSGWGENVPILL